MYELRYSEYWYASNPAFKEVVREYFGNRYGDVVFVEEIALKLKNGNYTTNPGVVFHTDEPLKGFKHNFIAFYKYPHKDIATYASGDKDTEGWVVAGLSNFNPRVEAMFTPTEKGGYITISRFGHDFVRAPLGTGAIDGGRDYTRVLGDPVPEVVTYNMLTKKFEKRGIEYDVVAYKF
jgi:hypothetical protein